MTTTTPVGVNEAWLDASAVATLLGVSARTVRRLATSGHLSYFRVGVQLRFSPDDVTRYVADSRFPAKQ
jgi:excisionase family DNA binding protein